MQAFTVAATGVASGAQVSLWLMGEASLQGVAGVEDVLLPHSPPLSQLRDAVLAGGTLTVCTQCAARRDITSAALIPGVRIAGAATLVEETLAADAKVLNF